MSSVSKQKHDDEDKENISSSIENNGPASLGGNMTEMETDRSQSGLTVAISLRGERTRTEGGEIIQSRYLKVKPSVNRFLDETTQQRHEEESIQVFVRVRPLNSMERAKNSYSILDCPGTREVVVKERSNSNVTKTFTFDRAFGPQSKQLDVYRQVVAPLLEKVIQGYNCTVFAYGQTGTGKTFTMEGERSEASLNWSEDPMAGIVPRALGQLFDELRQQNAEFTIRVSFLELYNEELYDLLAPVEGPKLKNLRMFEDPNKKNSITISGLEEVIVQSKHEVYQIMEKGSERRRTAATLMNASSSRSHTVLTVIVHIKESTMEGEDLLKIGKLNLVDLAGSENIGRSGAVDKRAREAGNINQSLLTLGRVITALVERAPHVPYRESKLTRILKDSLGGTTKTSIIATVSPANINAEETLSTLEYAHRAKNITNQPTVNQRLTKHLVMSHYTEEIERLRKDLAASREKNGIFVDKANYEASEAKLISLQQELSSSTTHIKNLNESVERYQAEVATKDAEISDLKQENETIKYILNETKMKLKNVEDNLRREREAKEEQQHLVERHVLTEKNLQQEATALISTADEVTSNIERLYNKLERKRAVEQTNLEAGKRLKKEIAEQLNEISDNIDNFRKDHATFCAEQRLKFEQFLEEQGKMAREFQEKTKENYNNLEAVCTESTNLVRTQNEVVLKLQDGNSTEIASKCQQSLEILQTVIHKIVKVELVDVATKVDATKARVQDVVEDFKTHIASQGATFSRYFEHNIKQLSMITEEINRLQEEQLSCNTVVSSAIGDHQKASFMFADMLDKKLVELGEALRNVSEETSRYKSHLTQNFSTISTGLENSDAKIKNRCSHLLEVLGKDVEELTNFQSSQLEAVNAYCTEAEENHKEIADQTEAISDQIKLSSQNLDELGCRQRELMECTQGVLEKGHKELETCVAEFQAKFDTMEVERAKHARLLTSNFENFARVQIEKDSDLISGTQDALKEHCVQVCEWSEGQRSSVYQQAGKVREFWDSTYLVDQPTGATPHRQVYTYPKSISATSPHDRIIGRFRARRNNYNDDEDRENF